MRTSSWISAILFLFSASADAGVFTTAHYLEPSEWSVGLEPELTFAPSGGSTGLGFTGRFTYGWNELSNASVLLGTGGGPRQLRVGGQYTFDFIPDIAGQPGIALATQALYLRRSTGGEVETLAIPSIREAFRSSGTAIEPYFALPMGFGFGDLTTEWRTQAVLGTLIQGSKGLRYTIEIGLNVVHSENYASTGISWQPE